MANDIFTPEYAAADEKLIKHSMQFVVDELPYLEEPSLLPDDIMLQSLRAGWTGSPCMMLGRWLTEEMANVCNDSVSRLPFDDVLAEYDIEPITAQVLRDAYVDYGHGMYQPGIMAVAELIELVPFVAQREGANQQDWADIANATRRFGAELAARSTFEQNIVRVANGLDASMYPALDPAFFAIDSEGGLTTVTPKELYFNSARSIIKTMSEGRGFPSSVDRCPALVARPSGLTTTMFNATWKLMVHVAEEQIYPNMSVVPQYINGPAGVMSAQQTEDRINAVITESIRTDPTFAAVFGY